MPETLRAKVSSKRLRYNLKNKPRFIVRSTFNEDMKRYFRESTEWFEGFEAELRKKLVHPTNTKSIAVYDFIKELLGDE